VALFNIFLTITNVCKNLDLKEGKDMSVMIIDTGNSIEPPMFVRTNMADLSIGSKEQAANLIKPHSLNSGWSLAFQDRFI